MAAEKAARRKQRKKNEILAKVQLGVEIETEDEDFLKNELEDLRATVQ